jgi:hypothetical protein
MEWDGHWTPLTPDWVDYPTSRPMSPHSEFLRWVYTLGDDDRRWVVAWCLQYTDPTHPLVTDYHGWLGAETTAILGGTVGGHVR